MGRFRGDTQRFAEFGLGAEVGAVTGTCVGTGDGAGVGLEVGSGVGDCDGAAVGLGVGSTPSTETTGMI